jgi:selenide,water dikinase
MKIDLEKRRRVMERSLQLGHCICDPRRPCPCDVFREQNLCPCAGERPDPVPSGEIRLTQWVRNAGCASKIPPADLEGVLARLPAVEDPAVVSGLAAADDAAIYRLAEGLHLVQTVDVFTPCVDDPTTFGRICAANCLSDVYAMGGQPRTALSVLAFPSETLDLSLVHAMLAGAMETLAQAGVALIGGHSLKDDEIKLGFAITGTIDPAQAAALDRPAPGDVLLLTKPLGTGVLAFAQQVGRNHPEGLAAATRSMVELNRAAAQAMIAARATACTDVTGFGLFGHLLRLCRSHQLAAELEAEALPAFPGVLEALRHGVISGAIERNREFISGDLEIGPGVDDTLVCLGCDAQTSGGLIIAIPPERLPTLQNELSRRGVQAFQIGRLAKADKGVLRLASKRGAPPSQPASVTPSAQQKTSASPVPAVAHDPGCCADLFQAQAPAPSEIPRAFGAFMRSAQAAGALDEKTKELILLSLVIQSRCSGCFAAHYRRAQELGISRAEMDEAAWCAVAMGGAPVKVFYQESLEQAERQSR